MVSCDGGRRPRYFWILHEADFIPTPSGNVPRVVAPRAALIPIRCDEFLPGQQRMGHSVDEILLLKATLKALSFSEVHREIRHDRAAERSVVLVAVAGTAAVIRQHRRDPAGNKDKSSVSAAWDKNSREPASRLSTNHSAAANSKSLPGKGGSGTSNPKIGSPKARDCRCSDRPRVRPVVPTGRKGLQRGEMGEHGETRLLQIIRALHPPRGLSGRLNGGQ